jgi:DNA-binding NarL/FixJ family response regulator
MTGPHIPACARLRSGPGTEICRTTDSRPRVSSDPEGFEAIKSGASGYLLKRLDADEFLEQLTDLAEGRAPFSAGLVARLLDEFARQAGRSRESLPQPAKNEPEPAAKLTPRQTQILTLVAQGKTYKDVGEAIGLSERTVKYHMAEILRCLHLENRAQVIAYAAQIGLSGKT